MCPEKLVGTANNLSPAEERSPPAGTLTVPQTPDRGSA